MRRSQITLTPTICQRTKPGPSKVVLWDGVALGLAFLVTPAGTKTWWFVARRDGKQIWIKIGEYQAPRSSDAIGDVWTCDAARDEAGRLRKLHDQGKDLRAIVQKMRKPNTISELSTHFMGSVAWRKMAPRSRTSYTGYFKNHIVPAIGKRHVCDLSYSDVVEMQRAIETKQEPPISVTAGLCVKLLGTVFDYAADIGWIDRGKNPCRGVEVIGAKDRHRVITPDEFARIGAALGDSQNADIVRLLAYSGLRVGEALCLPKVDVDLDGRVLTVKEHKTKKTMPIKILPINAAMTEVFSAQAVYLGPWVFRGLKGSHRKYASLQKWFAEIMVTLGLDITMHDFRRTFETVGVELGFPPGDMDVLVGHKLPGMQATYIHLSPGGILAQASSATSEWIKAALDAKKPRVGERVGAGETEKRA